MPPSSLLSPPRERASGRHSGSQDDDEEILPDDQVFEVLTCVALADLPACRAASARWRAITHEPAFAPLHCARAGAGAVSGYIVQSVTRRRHRADFVSAHPHPERPPLSLDFLPSRRVRVEAVAAGGAGLLCCAEAGAWRAPPRYFACKPSTKQWRALPSPRTRFRTAATAMAARRPRPSPGVAEAETEFRIVRLSIDPALGDLLRCEVFDSRRFAWRRAADVPLRPDSLRPLAPAVHAHGAAHWLRWDDKDTGAQDVFALHVGTGAWRLIALPREVEDVKERDPWARTQITALEGRLCLMLTTREEVLEVWEMASYAEGRWEKKTTPVSLKGLRAREGDSAILQDLSSPGVAFLDTFCKVMWYDFRKGDTIAEVQVKQVCVQEVFKYESDLIPCQIGRARRSPAAAAAVRTPAYKELDEAACPDLTPDI